MMEYVCVCVHACMHVYVHMCIHTMLPGARNHARGSRGSIFVPCSVHHRQSSVTCSTHTRMHIHTHTHTHMHIHNAPRCGKSPSRVTWQHLRPVQRVSQTKFVKIWCWWRQYGNLNQIVLSDQANSNVCIQVNSNVCIHYWISP